MNKMKNAMDYEKTEKNQKKVKKDNTGRKEGGKAARVRKRSALTENTSAVRQKNSVITDGDRSVK